MMQEINEALYLNHLCLTLKYLMNTSSGYNCPTSFPMQEFILWLLRHNRAFTEVKRAHNCS